MNIGTGDASFTNLKLFEFVPSSVKNLYSPFPSPTLISYPEAWSY